MRILSQDLKYDFPYEKVCIEMSDSGKIFAQGDVWGAENNYIEVARYSTAEKSQKAMEMLHEEWRDYGDCGMFYFPADDEIEV